MEEAATAEHHPARLQLFISTVHKTPAQTQTRCIYFCALLEYLKLDHFVEGPVVETVGFENEENELSSNIASHHM